MKDNDFFDFMMFKMMTDDNHNNSGCLCTLLLMLMAPAGLTAVIALLV